MKLVSHFEAVDQLQPTVTFLGIDDKVISSLPVPLMEMYKQSDFIIRYYFNSRDFGLLKRNTRHRTAAAIVGLLWGIEVDDTFSIIAPSETATWLALKYMNSGVTIVDIDPEVARLLV